MEEVKRSVFSRVGGQEEMDKQHSMNLGGSETGMCDITMVYIYMSSCI